MHSTNIHSDRLTTDEYFLAISLVVARRATCPRANVGCVIVKNGILIASGFNGSARGKPHCIDTGCVMNDGHCINTIHSEVNALLHAVSSVDGATMYSTHLACMECSKLIVNSGIARLLYIHDYIDNRCSAFQIANQQEYLIQAGIKVEKAE
jgi:dCMP deaminase